MNTLRYTTHFGQFIHVQYASLFQYHYANTHANWFAFQVFLPVSMLLIGGYFLSKQTPIGFFLPGGAFCFV